MKTTLGGERIGSGNKNKISLRNYERSTHDLSYTWRSTIAPGTLVPFMSQVALPGDTFDIDINLEVNTLPTIGELFGSFKVEAHVFSVPMRLYNAKTNINMVNIGLDMKSIKLPKMKLFGKNPYAWQDVIDLDNYQVNSSSLFSYLGIRGLGYSKNNNKNVERNFNAIPFLAYWDIFKNYYANKQEEKGYVIHNAMDIKFGKIEHMEIAQISGNYATRVIDEYSVQTDELHIVLNNSPQNNPLCEIAIEISGTSMTIGELRQNLDRIQIYVTQDGYNNELNKTIPITELFEHFEIEEGAQGFFDIRGKNVKNNVIYYTKGFVYDTSFIMSEDARPQLHTFPLEDIDKMKMEIFSRINQPFFNVNDTAVADNLQPYNMILNGINYNESLTVQATPYMGTQEGLALKTYSSDKFNNWIDTEWIDGDNGIAQITAVKVDEETNTFTIDELNLANKVYNMLMRIAVSGGTYDDYLEASYDHERVKEVKSPVYEGGLIRELVFQEVVSTTENENISLGTVVGRGVMTDKRKGGKMVVRINEPSYIMGIISITPRVDYSQGNSWDVNLDNLDDLHKPGLDEIGFQDLITDEMAWFDTEIDGTALGSGIKYKSAGKVPAWQNYMTNVNILRGNFANSSSQMWMTLNRKYSGGKDKMVGINDLTTYIDPTKFNHIFADTRLDAQNFMVHMGIGITARRKMSAKVMPNL